MLAEFCNDLPRNTRAVYIVSHSRSLVGQLADMEPNYLHLGEKTQKAPQSLQEWLSRPVVPRDPTLLAEESHRRFQKIQKILDRRD
jgi:hypothetical protein